jgi:phosphatidylglycerol:prolipoprotein diacylglycerol transferase
MYPEILHLSFLHTYGVLVAITFLAGVWMCGRLAKTAGLNPESVTNLGIYSALAAMAGAKVMMLIVDPESRSNLFSFATLQAGGVFYGGLIAALLVAWWYMRKTKLPVLATADVFAPAIALGHGIGRIGCFSAGCCWGARCDLPWAVTFRNPTAKALTGVPLNQPLHPTQLYESIAEFAIFAILYRLFHKPHGKGTIIALYLMLYGTVRFVVEFFRFHEQGNQWGPFDTSQVISLCLVALGASRFILGRKLDTAPAR